MCVGGRQGEKELDVTFLKQEEKGLFIHGRKSGKFEWARLAFKIGHTSNGTLPALLFKRVLSMII